MKSKLLIIGIVAVVAIVHALVFLLPQRLRTASTEDQSGSSPPEKRELTRSVEPVERGRPASATVPEEGASAAVNEAVSHIQKNKSVTAAAPPDPLPGRPSTPAAESTQGPGTEDNSSDATMIVGIVEGQSKLPPELFEVAEEGAKAVAAQNWERARELYLTLVNEAPDNALGYANLGVAEHQLGNLLAASGNLRKSLEINPSIAQNWQTLGIIHYERDELELAISSLTRAIHEDPSDPRSRLYLAAVIRSYGWIEASITELERAVETDPEFADAHYNLAVSYLEVNPPRIELARRHYFSAVDLGADPSTEMEAVFVQDAKTNE